jgi:hypothetical protein
MKASTQRIERTDTVMERGKARCQAAITVL